MPAVFLFENIGLWLCSRRNKERTRSLGNCECAGSDDGNQGISIKRQLSAIRGGFPADARMSFDMVTTLDCQQSAGKRSFSTREDDRIDMSLPFWQDCPKGAQDACVGTGINKECFLIWTLYYCSSTLSVGRQALPHFKYCHLEYFRGKQCLVHTDIYRE